MSLDANRALVERYIDEVWHAGQPAIAFFAPGYRRYLAPEVPPLSGAEQQERIRGFRTAFPDLRFTIETLVAEGDLVVFHCTLRGTHEGTFAGYPATGRRMTIGLIDIVRIHAGRFVEHWGGPDLFGLYRQLALPLPPHP